MDYPITCAVIPEGKIGEAGVNALLELIENGMIRQVAQEIPPTLLVGKTTAVAPREMME
jgi:hypothetical protein